MESFSMILARTSWAHWLETVEKMQAQWRYRIGPAASFRAVVYPTFVRIIFDTSAKSPYDLKSSSILVVIRHLSRMVAERLLHFMENKLMQQRLAHRLRFKYWSEATSIKHQQLFDRSMLIWRGHEQLDISDIPDRLQAIRRLSEEIHSVWKVSQNLDLTGIICFRQKCLHPHFDDAIAAAYDVWSEQQQYESFLQCLQWMMEEQNPQLEALHLVHQSGTQFQFYDALFQPMDESYEQDPNDHEWLEIADEEQLLTRMIRLAPRRSFIYTKNPQAPVIKTICRIFDSYVRPI